MSKTSDSLSSQNMGGRAAGEGARPSRSASVKTKLWKRLQKLDSRISKNLYYQRRAYQDEIICKHYYAESYTQFKNLDEKRKQMRLKLKSFGRD
jgi:DNA repair photolyase